MRGVTAAEAVVMAFAEARSASSFSALLLAAARALAPAALAVSLVFTAVRRLTGGAQGRPQYRLLDTVTAVAGIHDA